MYVPTPTQTNLVSPAKTVNADNITDNSQNATNSPSNDNALTPGELLVDKISLDVPIIWNVEEGEILNRLKEGVAHYRGTSKPGGGGNIFIVGHSSNYFWVRSDYNDVFALLDKLVKGDRIEIIQDGRKYSYGVVDKKTVSPTDVSVIDSTNKEILSLMTCWPVGTNINRLVVQSELLSIQ